MVPATQAQRVPDAEPVKKIEEEHARERADLLATIAGTGAPSGKRSRSYRRCPNRQPRTIARCVWKLHEAVAKTHR